MSALDPFAFARAASADDDAPLSPAEREFLRGIKRMMPHYRIDLSYLGKKQTAANRVQAIESEIGRTV